MLEGAFKKSSSTLKEFKIDPSDQNSKRVVKTGAFSNLGVLETIELGFYWQHYRFRFFYFNMLYSTGNHYDRFETGAFNNLPFLREIVIPPKTLQWMEPKAFTDLPRLGSLDLHDQLFSTLPQNLTFG